MDDALVPALATLEIIASPPSDSGRAIARMDRAQMTSLNLRAGDMIRISAARATHARAMPAKGDGYCGKIGLDAGQQETLGPPGTAVDIAPVTLPHAQKVKLDKDINPARLMDLPLTEGDLLAVTEPGAAPAASVLSVQPDGAGRVDAHTIVTGPYPRSAPSPYLDVGGLGPQIASLREIVALPLERPDLFAHLGIAPPRGVLFTGPPGSGKTLLARAVAQETQAAFFQISGPEIVSKHYGESEAQLRDLFSEAQRQMPAIIFIDEIDAIAPRRDEVSGEKQLERRIVGQLLTLMDGLADRGDVVVMAATNLPDSLDPALRRPGRFDREIVFTAPDRTARRAILDVHLRATPLADDVDLDDLAEGLHGYSGADIAALVQEAAMASLARHLPRDTTDRSFAGLDTGRLTVARQDFDSAAARISPSILRGTVVDMPDIGWEDVGGLGAAKQELIEAVVWPLQYPKARAALNLPRASGVLLSGPPGTGKTLLARALAGESGVNFVPVRGAAVLSQYLGAAERAVREIFARAAQTAPCILFFDEIDAIAPRRGSADTALERVVAELLIEIDGLSRRPDIFLLGATNRVDAIDAALLRPGRFDVTIELGPPDAAARKAILEVHGRKMPLSPDLDLYALVERTEGWTGADLAALCQGAARHALRSAVRAADGAPIAPDSLAIGTENFERAFDARCASDAASHRDRPQNKGV